MYLKGFKPAISVVEWFKRLGTEITMGVILLAF